MIGRDDLVALLCEIGAHRGEPLGVLTVTEGERYNTRRLYRAYCDALDKGPLLPSPPAGVWRLASGLLDRLHGEVAGSTWDRLTGDACHQTAGLDALAWQPSLSFEGSLAP